MCAIEEKLSGFAMSLTNTSKVSTCEHVVEYVHTCGAEARDYGVARYRRETHKTVLDKHLEGKYREKERALIYVRGRKDVL